MMDRRRALMMAGEEEKPKISLFTTIQGSLNNPNMMKDSDTSFHFNGSSTNYAYFMETINAPVQAKDLVGKKIGVRFKRTGTLTGVYTEIALFTNNSYGSLANRKTNTTQNIQNILTKTDDWYSLEIDFNSTVPGQYASSFPTAYLKLYWALNSSTTVTSYITDIEFYYK